MADNVAITAGSGTTVATDDVSSAHFQKIKLADGTADSSTMVEAGAGTAAGALRVTFASDAAVISVDDNGGSLTVDNSDVTTIAGAVSGSEMQVDVVASLPAGTNAIGKLAANSGVDIGDVDVTSMPATAAEGAALPSAFVVVAADDGTDVVPLQATSGGDLKVTMDSEVVAVDATGQGDVPVTLDGEAVVLGAGTAAIGKLAANSGVDIGDVDVTSLPGVAGDTAHDATDSGNPLGVGAQARTTNPTAVGDGDRVRLIADDVGRLLVVPHAPRDLVVQQTTDTTNTTETTIVSAGASGVFHDLTHLAITNASDTATVVTLRDDTAGSAIGKYALAANGGIVLSFPTPLKQTAAADNWTIQSSATVNLHVVAQAVKNV